ncbi:type II secretion system F family protein [Gilvimarinus chinensis]|uniref:type II secretion system F family protein n=1 Tax=Gilvimarinus chinensis TaxID=396005 RepID=UPI00037F6247|nr:type II secretion system F family protein [Gilvimarinus chinensis]
MDNYFTEFGNLNSLSDSFNDSLQGLKRSFRFSRAKQADFLRAFAGPMSVGKQPIEICEHILKHGSTVQKEVATLILASLEEGGGIASAMEGWIDPVSLSALKATEEAGSDVFVRALERIAESLEVSSQGRAKIIKLAIYPAIILIATIAIMIYPVGPVIESLKLMIHGKSDPTLDSMTSLIKFYVHWLWLVALIGIGLIIGYRWYMANSISSFRRRIDQIAIFSGYRLSIASKFISTFALLKEFGMPASRIFNILKDSGNNYQRYHATLSQFNLGEGAISEVDAMDTGLLDDSQIATLHLYASADDDQLIAAMNKAADVVGKSISKRSTYAAYLVALLIGGWAFYNVIMIVSVLVGFNPKDHMQIGV